MILAMFLSATCLPYASAQTSSLGARQRRADIGKVQPLPTREAPEVERNPVYVRYSWISVPHKEPKTFKVGDLLTIIVRESRQYEADAELQSRRKYGINTKLDAFLRPINGGFGAATFRRGKPEIDYAVENTLRSTADTTREDRLTTRLTVTIIDVKPNGLLVLEGQAKMVHDDETSEITFTGTCRKADVTADNTILSTQIADKVVIITNRGALRVASSRGWIHKVVDFLRPF